jgi:CubicO group peptidase (beta-lactamase class C family)
VDKSTLRASIRLDRGRLQHAVAVAEAAVRTGPYPSAVLAAANADTTFLTHVVTHPEYAPVALDSIFLIASITKPIVATAIMRLVEEGRLLLSDHVVQHIPEFAESGKQAVTVWHILTHTSGLEEESWRRELSERRAPDEEFLRAACRSHLHFEPGTRYEYCSLSFTILGELITRLSGLPYPEYLRRQIFEPLGMRDTSFAPTAAPQSRTACVYGVDADSERFANYIGTTAAPGAALWSTAADLIAFGQALLRGGLYNGYHLLAPASIEAMTRLYTAGMTEIRDNQPVPVFYGLGWGKPALDGTTLASPHAYRHGGATGTLLLVDPQWNLVFVFLTNRWGIEGQAPNMALNALYGALRRD